MMREFPFDFLAHIRRHIDFSERTFGPGPRAAGVVDHIRKELREIEAAPHDLEEWIDVLMLALDGAWRSGATPEQIVAQLVAKQTKNEGRKWPDWRTATPGKAIEHDRSGEQAEHFAAANKMIQPKQTCNCRRVGDVQTQQCTLHEAHIAAIHEWADRAKAAEAKLAALEQQEQEQEPVAVKQHDPDIHMVGPNDGGRVWIEELSPIPVGTKLYTRPPRREWQFLSAEERYRIADESTATIVAVLATEAKLKEINT
jgi:hypothetical protein